MRMTTYKPKLQGAGRQGGAVILLVTFSLIAFMLLAALALDVGVSYIGKSQLQNAADAGALRGARELNGTATGLANAENKAREGAGANDFLLAMNPLQSGNVTVQFASHPYPGDWVAADQSCRTTPTNCFYIRVDTAGSRTAWFSLDVGASGIKALAVAGRTTCEMMPMFICGDAALASDPNRPYGFWLGRAYSFVPSPSGNVGPGNVGYLHPTGTGTCAGISSIGTPEMQRLACIGQMPCFSLPADRCTVTQPARPNIARAINTRFDDFPPSLPNDLNAQVCPPDRNIQEFTWNGAGGTASAGLWMEGNPTAQTTPPGTDPTAGIGSAPASGDQGVWWSYVTPPTPYVAPPTATPPGTPLRTAIPTINRPPGIDSAYPNVSPWVSPYAKTVAPYIREPRPAHQAAANSAQQPRRLLRMAVATGCPVAGGTGSPVRIVAIGKFFMQTQADGTGSQDMITGEFAGFEPALETTYPEIRLFR